MLLVVVTLSFSACSLFVDDLDTKYSPDTMVATIDNSNITVSRQELYYEYRTWGYQYASQMETNELLEYLTEYLLNNKILAALSREQFGDLDEIEQAQALKYTYDSLDSAWRSYVYEIMDVDDPEEAEHDHDEDNADAAVVYEPYDKSIYVNKVTKTDQGHQYQDYEYQLNLAAYEDTTGILRLSDYQTYTPNVPGIASDKVARQALAKIVRNLQNAEKGFNRLTKPANNYLDLENPYLKTLTMAEQDALNREIARLVENNQRSILVSRFSVAYDLGFITLDNEAAKTAWKNYLTRSENWEDWQKNINQTTGKSVAGSQAADTVEYYLDQVRQAIKSYDYQTINTALEQQVVSNGLENVYYIPSQIANNLFTVSHILVSFTDEQKAQYTKITEEANKNPSYNPQPELNKLYAACSSNGKSIYDIYNEVKTTLDGITDLQQKYDTFRDFIYQYNSDPGMQNPTYEYLMSTTTENNTMVEAFTAASIALKQNTNGLGGKGAISGIVWSDYGAHIIMYTRDISEFIWTQSETMLALSYGDTLFAPLTAYGNQTQFDALATNFTRSYNSYRLHLLADYKHDHTVNMVQSEFKNFF